VCDLPYTSITLYSISPSPIFSACFNVALAVSNILDFVTTCNLSNEAVSIATGSVPANIPMLGATNSICSPIQSQPSVILNTKLKYIFVLSICAPYAYSASFSKKLLLSQLFPIALISQVALHDAHPIHKSGFITALFPSNVIAFTGHFATHSPQPIHFFPITGIAFEC